MTSINDPQAAGPTAMVLYASTHGHTQKVAEAIAARLREKGMRARIFEAGDPETPGPEGADLVAAGGSVHAAHHQPDLRTWLRRHGDELDLTRAGIFSVSLTAADTDDDARGTVAEYAAELVEELPGPPAEVATFAGALQYREYSVATKVLMRLVAGHRDLPTDWHEDTDYTDWDAVVAFADRLAALVPVAAPVTA